MSSIARKIMLGAGALLTIFAVYLLIGPDSRRIALLKRLETEGLVAQAKVTAKYVEEYTSYDNSGSRAGRRSAIRIINDHNRRAESAKVNYLYFVDVEFVTGKGQTIRSKEEVQSQHFSGITVGAQLPILYHPEDPAEVSRLKDRTSPYRDMSDIFNVIAMFMLTVAAALFWFGRPRGDTVPSSGWETAASHRMENLQKVKSAPSQAPARRVAAVRSTAPKGFGQQRRAARI